MTQSNCLICQTSTDRTCANCLAPHCTSHLLSQSCPGCKAELWGLECRQVRRTGSMFAFFALPLAATSVMLGTSGALAYLAFPAAFAAIVGISAVPASLRPLFRRRLAGKRLQPTSQPMRLVAGDDVSPEERDQSEYSRRRRHPPRKAKRTSVLGSFYKI
jgi:hypothetical protein